MATPEGTNWRYEPSPTLVVDFLRGYLRHNHTLTQDQKLPSPLLGHIINKPTYRRNYAPLFLGSYIALDEQLQRGIPKPMAAEDIIPSRTQAQRIALHLDTFRRGDEGIIPNEDRQTIHELASAKEDPLITLGKLAIAGLSKDWVPALGIAQDALLAAELHAIAQPNDSAA